MSIFNKDKSENKGQPENTTKPKSDGNKITAAQWVKNSGHSLKGLFLEWLSEQELFSIVGGEIKAVKKSMKKKRLSPKEKKTLKQKLADLSEGAIAKFGKDYLGQDSPEETKEYIKDGLNTIMKQVKTGNFHEKDNLFGDDEEMNTFMDQLEDEWDEDEDYEASEESFSYKDLVAKYNKGFGEFISAKDSRKIIESEKIPGLSRRVSKFGPYFFQEDFSPGEFKFQKDRHFIIMYYVDNPEDDINDIQMKVRKNLLENEKLFNEIKVGVMTPDIVKKYDITKLDGISSVNIYPDGKLEASSRYVFKDDEGEYEGDGDEILIRKGKGESIEIVADRLSPVGESYDENKMLYNLRKNIFD